VLEFWTAVATVLPREWGDPRKHYLTKGVGVYALMGLLADLWNEWPYPVAQLGRPYFEAALSDIAGRFDWSTSGPLKGLGGGSGAQHALELLRVARQGTLSAPAAHLRWSTPPSQRHPLTPSTTSVHG
jgi:DNA sulfur modification protein DndB